MNQAIIEIKEEQKKLAKEIRELRKERRGCWQVYEKSREYRHRHIARCELRGRTREQIEQTVREGNEPSEYLINKYKDEYQERIRACQEVHPVEDE